MAEHPHHKVAANYLAAANDRATIAGIPLRQSCLGHARQLHACGNSYATTADGDAGDLVEALAISTCGSDADYGAIYDPGGAVERIAWHLLCPGPFSVWADVSEERKLDRMIAAHLDYLHWRDAVLSPMATIGKSSDNGDARKFPWWLSVYARLASSGAYLRDEIWWDIPLGQAAVEAAALAEIAGNSVDVLSPEEQSAAEAAMGGADA